MDVLEDQAAMVTLHGGTFGASTNQQEPEQMITDPMSGPAESSSLSSDLTMGSEDQEVDQDSERTAAHQGSDHAESVPVNPEATVHQDGLLASPSLPQAAYLAAVTEATPDSDGPFAVADFVLALKSAAEAVNAGVMSFGLAL